jgi:hypothetical protein
LYISSFCRDQQYLIFGHFVQSYRDNPKINAIVLVKGRLEDWPQLPPVPVEPEEDDLTEEHKVPTFIVFSVADPGCSSRIQLFSIPDPGSVLFSIPDPPERI